MGNDGKNPNAVALGKLGGKKGGKARAAKLSAERRREIAQKAAEARWAAKKKRAAEKTVASSDLPSSTGGARRTDEVEDGEKNPNAVALGKLGGKKGGKARAAKLSAERRQEIARKAAEARWAAKRKRAVEEINESTDVFSSTKGAHRTDEVGNGEMNSNASTLDKPDDTEGGTANSSAETVAATSKSFAGTSPGQSLEELVERLSQDSLGVVLGEDVLELVRALAGLSDKQATTRRIAVAFLRDRAEETMVRPEVRAICLDAMSQEKLAEFAKRIGASNVQALHDLDPSQDAETWRAFLGFFGIDARGAAPFAAALARETARSGFGLFPHQREAADAVANAVRGGHGRVVLHMPTGAGKTRTAMHVVSRFLCAMEPRVVVWLASSAELLDQAADAFQEAWLHLGNRDVDLLRFWGDHAPDLLPVSDGLLVAGLQKMHAFKRKDPIGVLRLAKSVDLVIVDEAHQAIAPTYREIIETLSETGAHNALVGLTATPGRTWSDIAADERLSDFFQGRKVMLEVEGWDDPVSFLIAEGYLARPTFRRLEISAPAELKPRMETETGAGDDYSSALLDSLSDQLDRNIAIIEEARRLIEVGHTRILLFGASVRHAEVLAAAFSALGIESPVVTGRTAVAARERAINAFRRPSSRPMILCNFGVLTTGFDAPNTSAAIIARPTRSLVLFSQMVGRATRGPKVGGNATCEISTVVDIDLPGFGDVAEAFTNWEDVWNEPS